MSLCFTVTAIINLEKLSLLFETASWALAEDLRAASQDLLYLKSNQYNFNLNPKPDCFSH